MQKPYLNLGCGTIILPGPQPVHHSLVPAEIYNYPLWENVDRNIAPGVDRVVDLFRYPWPLESNAYDGALLSHLAEHIPHEINNQDVEFVGKFQDGWFAFFSELYRILTPGARVHILSPYAWTHAAMTDPSHTRYLTEAVFLHSLMPDNNGPAFHYATGDIKFQVISQPVYNVMPKWTHLIDNPEELKDALHTYVNVVYDFAIVMECVK